MDKPQRKSVARAAVLHDALNVLEPDGDAEARLRWLVSFAQRDLQAMSSAEWVHEHLRLLFVGHEEEWSARDSFTYEHMGEPIKPHERRDVRAIQGRLLACFGAL